MRGEVRSRSMWRPLICENGSAMFVEEPRDLATKLDIVIEDAAGDF